MTAIVFETPGHIDMRAFTIMGAHAKPNTPNPIGYFGTGLKYAIAVLVRLGCEPVVWIGRDRLTFSKLASKFRGTDLETISMHVLKDGQTRGNRFELPYTTSYGKNWEPWQVFRELESNTRDENGQTWHDTAERDGIIGQEGLTRIVVDLPEFIAVWEQRDTIFLPGAGREGDLLEALPGESNLIYYRGMRVLELPEPTLFTYNILEKMQLTEDRTLAWHHQIKDVLARFVLSKATKEQVLAVASAPEGSYERDLSFTSYHVPSLAVREVMAERPKGLSRNFHAYASHHKGPRVRHEEKPWSLAEEHPGPWKRDGVTIVDANGLEVLAMPDGYQGNLSDDWERTAEALLKRLAHLPLQ